MPGASDRTRGWRLLVGFVLLSFGLNGSATELGTRRTLAGCHCERPLSRGESRDGVAARGVGETDGKRVHAPSWRRSGHSTVGHLLAILVVILPPSLCWSRSSIGSGRFRSAPVSWSSGFGIFRLVGAVAIRGRSRGYDRHCSDSGPRAWQSLRCGIDARADISRALQGRRSRQGVTRPPTSSIRRRSWHGRRGLRRPFCRDDRRPADCQRG